MSLKIESSNFISVDLERAVGMRDVSLMCLLQEEHYIFPLRGPRTIHGKMTRTNLCRVTNADGRLKPTCDIAGGPT